MEVIIKKYDSSDLKGKEHIINVLNRGEIKFETLVGEDFIFEIEEKHNNLKTISAGKPKKAKQKVQTKKAGKTTKSVKKENKKMALED